MTDQRQRNRDRYPDVAAFVDECRRVFGEDQVRVVELEGADERTD